MNGSDHLPPQPELSSMLQHRERRDGRRRRSSTARCRSCSSASKTSSASGAARVAAARGRVPQRPARAPAAGRAFGAHVDQAGEPGVRGPARALGGAVLDWADILKKQVGREWTEPLPPTTAHMPFPTSDASIAALIDRAWRHLLENQPHDSICGCSVDGVHEEMRQRYRVGEGDRRGDRAAVAAHDRRAGAG